MYLNGKKITCHYGGKLFTIIIPNVSEEPITPSSSEKSIRELNISMTTEQLVPIIIDVYPLDEAVVDYKYEVDNDVVEIKSGLIIPKRSGNSVVKVKTLDETELGTINVTVVQAETVAEITSAETYNVVNADFGIASDGITETCDAINTMLNTKSAEGIKKVVFQNGTYIIGNDKSIQPPSGMTIDLNGSTLRQEGSAELIEGWAVVRIASGSHNIRITNGYIHSDRQDRDPSFNMEFRHCIVCEGSHIELDNLDIGYTTGYGVAFGAANPKNIAYISLNNLTETSVNCWKTISPIDISNLETYIQYCYYFGYCGWGFIKDSAKIRLRILDSNKNIILQYDNYRPYQIVPKPDNAKYIDMDILNTEITGSNTDFNNCIGMFAEFDSTDYINMHDCYIHHCKSLGTAYSSKGLHNIIRNCTYDYNGGAYATADIDFEDGWEFMRYVTVRDNRFLENSTRSIVVCAGDRLIFYNNTFKGGMVISDRATNTLLMNNTFDYETRPNQHVEIVTEWYSGAAFIEGNDFYKTWFVVNNARDVQNIKRLYLKDNRFYQGGIINQSKHETISGLSMTTDTTIVGDVTDSIIITGTDE